MRELALRRVINHVFQRRVDRLVAQLHLENLVGIGRETVEERGLHGGRFLADDAGQRGALGAVTLAGGAEAAEQMDLERRGLRELIGRELRGALVEVVGNAHRADRVRARRARSDLVELVDRRDHRSLGLLDDIEIGRNCRSLGLRRRLRWWRAVGGCRRASREDGGGADEGGPHHEGAAVNTRRYFVQPEFV